VPAIRLAQRWVAWARCIWMASGSRSLSSSVMMAIAPRYTRGLPKSRLEAQRSSVVPWTNEVDFAVSKVGLKELWTLNWHRQFNIVNGWTKAGGIQPQNWPAWMQGFKDY
jgi:hypothetical protein